MDSITTRPAGAADLGWFVPPDYACRLTRRAADIQMIVDASDPMVATSALDVATALGADRALDVMAPTMEGTVLRRESPPVDFRVRAWYNPERKGRMRQHLRALTADAAALETRA